MNRIYSHILCGRCLTALLRLSDIKQTRKEEGDKGFLLNLWKVIEKSLNFTSGGDCSITSPSQSFCGFSNVSPTLILEAFCTVEFIVSYFPEENSQNASALFFCLLRLLTVFLLSSSDRWHDQPVAK